MLALLLAGLALPVRAEDVVLRHSQGEKTVDAPVAKVLILDVNALDIAAGADLIFIGTRTAPAFPQMSQL